MGTAIRGRGRHYTPRRALVERALTRFYAGGWARHIADAHSGSSRVEVSPFTVAAIGWPAGAPPVRAALLTDLHAGPTTSRIALAGAFAATAAARPDLVLLGGDYIFLDARHVDELAPLLRGLAPPLGIFAVMGNHDLWADDRHIAAVLDGAGARVLVNEMVRAGPLQLVGLDDPWTGVHDPGRAFATVDARAPIVVLAHAPEALALVGERRFDLLACGHTHGGHVCLPGGIPLVVPGAIGREHPRGRHDLPTGGVLLVGRGVGGIESPLRAWARPQVPIIEIGPPVDSRAAVV